MADGGEVVVDDLAVGLEAGFVPGGAELAATADVGEDVDAAALKPELADDAGVARGLGDLEATVGGHERGVGAVILDVFAVDDEVGDLGSVGGGGLELFDDEIGGVELRGQGFCGFQGCCGCVAQEKRCGREEAGGFEEEVIVGGVGALRC